MIFDSKSSKNGPTTMSCALADVCSGCDRIFSDRGALRNERYETLKELGLFEARDGGENGASKGNFPVEHIWIQAGALRDRLEFTLAASPDRKSPASFGLFDKNVRSNIVDISVCPQLSPSLQNWLTDFRRDLPPLRSRGAVRLRVSPEGRRGVWLDFSNESIRDILDEGDWIQRQLERDVVVEMGQKRKRVILNKTGPRAHRLTDPVFEPWFETPLTPESKLKTAKLFGTIGTFTQPGFLAQTSLVENVFSHIQSASRPLRVAEFGSGIGAFTLPLLASGASVDAFESDRTALAALELGIQTANLDRSRLTVHPGDFILSAKAADQAEIATSNFDLVIVDPPRPGLGTFVQTLADRTRGSHWIYVSCFPESFAKDKKALEDLGLTMKRLTIVEQFPFTRHFELIASFAPATL